MTNKAFMHQEISEIPVWIHPEVFFNYGPVPAEHNHLHKGKIFGVICEPGNIITFDVITEDGFVFSNVPPHSVQTKEDAPASTLTWKDLVYFDCPSHDFTYCTFKHLQDKDAFVAFKGQPLIKGKYLFSIDFYNDYNWYHCIELETGYLSFMPSHKIVFKKIGQVPTEKFSFPSFLKLRKAFSKGG